MIKVSICKIDELGQLTAPLTLTRPRDFALNSQKILARFQAHKSHLGPVLAPRAETMIIIQSISEAL